MRMAQGLGGGMEIAQNAMNMVAQNGRMMQQAQALEQGRMELGDEQNVRKAYEHIAQKLGNNWDVSALDNDPILHTRHGTMAFGRFMNDRANSEQGRLQMVNSMREAEDIGYQSFFRPLAMSAQEAFQAGDMRRFGTLVSELSQKSPLPYNVQSSPDGNFKLLFRSDTTGGYTDTGQTLTPQEVFNEIIGVMGGDQVVAGGIRGSMAVNPRYAAAAARYKIGTIMGNAATMSDPSRWVTLQDPNGHTVQAVPQNRHDDYTAAPSYWVVGGGIGGKSMMSMDELDKAGYRLVNQRMRTQGALGRGGGSRGSSTGFGLSADDRKWISTQVTGDDGLGNPTTDAYKGMALETLMGVHGLNRYAAVQAYESGVDSIAAQVQKENKDITPEYARRFAAQRYIQWLSQGGQQQPSEVPASTQPQPVAQQQQNALHDDVGGIAKNTLPPIQPPKTRTFDQLRPDEQAMWMKH